MIGANSPQLLGALLCAFYILIKPSSCGTTGAATATLPFEPLFTKPPTFVYTFESNTTEELIATEGIFPGQPDPSPRVSWKFWLEYANTDAVLDSKSLFQTDVAFMFAGRNLTLPDPDGAYNGCERALGKTCAQRLIDVLKKKLSGLITLYSASIDIEADFDTPSAEELSCPWDLFEEFIAPHKSTEKPSVANENAQKTYLIPAGNASYPMIARTDFNATAERELNKIIVSVMARVPLSMGTRKDVNNIQVELLCMKAVAVDPHRDQATATGKPTGSSASQKSSAASIVEANVGFTAVFFQSLLSFLFIFTL